MKVRILSLVTATSLLVLPIPTASAQSIKRVRQSLDRATGGQMAPPNQTLPAAPAAPVLTPEQVAAAQAAQAAQLKRQKEASAAAEAKVIPFLKERVAGGSADAAYDLAKRYETGKGVAEDPKEARRLYQLAAERDNSDAKTWLKEHPATAIVTEKAKDKSIEKSAIAKPAATAATAGASKPATPAVPGKSADAK